jgi:hypothetical protein
MWPCASPWRPLLGTVACRAFASVASPVIRQWLVETGLRGWPCKMGYRGWPLRCVSWLRFRLMVKRVRMRRPQASEEKRSYAILCRIGRDQRVHRRFDA